MGATSCVDEIKFGNSFLEKAPGGSATQDTIFNSVTYTRQFLNTCYSRQYYGLPYVNSSVDDFPDSSNPYTGKFDALTDCWQLHYSGTTIYNSYYSGTHTANYGVRGDIFGYTREGVWQTVRWCWLLLENVDRVPGMGEDEKVQMKAEKAAYKTVKTTTKGGTITYTKKKAKVGTTYKFRLKGINKVNGKTVSVTIK